MELAYQKLHPDVPDLSRGSDHAAGLDLVNDGETVEFGPGESMVIPTGVAVAIPEGCFGQVSIRSGFGFKQNLVAHLGVIDADYRGEIKVKVFNQGDKVALIGRHERFAQLVIQRYEHLHPKLVTALPRTERGHGGFGSTGA